MNRLLTLAEKLKVDQSVIDASVHSPAAFYRFMGMPQRLMPRPLGELEAMRNGGIGSDGINSYGFRSPELICDEPAEILTLGCSVTYGAGLPLEYTWPKVLSDLTGMTYHNLGLIGLSADVIQGLLYSYVQTIGKPKYVVIMLPDLVRANYPIIPSLNCIDKPTNFDVVGTSFSAGTIHNMPTYAKKPYNLKDVLANEVAMYQSTRVIMSIIMYCRAANINLIWTSWDLPTLELYNHLIQVCDNFSDEESKQHLNEYLSVYPYPDDSVGPNHQDIEDIPCTNHTDLEYKSGVLFHVAADEQRHPGAHRNAHWAEAMCARIKEMERG